MLNLGVPYILWAMVAVLLCASDTAFQQALSQGLLLVALLQSRRQACARSPPHRQPELTLQHGMYKLKANL
jgi:hypothetical protein